MSFDHHSVRDRSPCNTDAILSKGVLPHGYMVLDTLFLVSAMVFFRLGSVLATRRHRLSSALKNGLLLGEGVSFVTALVVMGFSQSLHFLLYLIGAG